jgi:hypothetical protein
MREVLTEMSRRRNEEVNPKPALMSAVVITRSRDGLAPFSVVRSVVENCVQRVVRAYSTFHSRMPPDRSGSSSTAAGLPRLANVGGATGSALLVVSAIQTIISPGCRFAFAK